MTLPDIAAYASLIAALWALKLAVSALKLARKTDNSVSKTARDVSQNVNDLRSVVKQLDFVREGLSTKSVGLFPDYLENIVTILGDAQERVEVLCDFPAYGSISRPKVWHEYHRVLMTRPSITRDVVCLSSAQRDAISERQFSPSEWSSAIRAPDFRQRLKAFADLHQKDNEIEELVQSRGAFLALLRDVQEDEARRLNAVTTDELVPLYCWIADGRRAIFAVAALPSMHSDNAASGSTQEVGFETSDRQLILALRTIVGRYQRAGVPSAAAEQ